MVSIKNFIDFLIINFKNKGMNPSNRGDRKEVRVYKPKSEEKNLLIPEDWLEGILGRVVTMGVSCLTGA